MWRNPIKPEQGQERVQTIGLVSQMTIEERASRLRYDAPAIERLANPIKYSCGRTVKWAILM